MNITRSPLQGSKKVQSDAKPIILDLSTLDLYCRYVLSENALIRNSNLVTMRKLFEDMDVSVYNGDPERLKRIQFIKKGLEAKLDARLTNRDFVISYVNGGFGSSNNSLDTSRFDELNNSEIDFCNKVIADNVKFNFMYKYADDISDICQRFKSADFSMKAPVVREFEETMAHVNNEFRRVRNEDMNSVQFNLSENFESVVTDVYNREVSPSRRLKTGIQGLNKMINGGFEAGRLYILFGLAAAGKSFTMLDLMMQIKKYNVNYICHDKTKKPCVVLLTMENSVHETITRLFSLITGKSMNSYASVQEVISILKNQGRLIVSVDNPIDIIIKYKPNLSVDTSYLYDFYDDLEDEGYEPIAVFQDHIKRIRPVYGNKDMRLDLGEIANEFKAFAVEKDIPVITDSHLNRDAAKTLEQASRANKADLATLLGSSNVSESMLMVDNCDVGMIITKDMDRGGNQYMGWMQIKTRTKCDMDYFAQPFEENNAVKLVEDVGFISPAYKMTLRDEEKMNNSKNYLFNRYGIIDDLNMSEEEYQEKLRKREEKEAKKNNISSASDPYPGSELLDFYLNQSCSNTQDTHDKELTPAIFYYGQNGELLTEEEYYKKKAS